MFSAGRFLSGMTSEVTSTDSMPGYANQLAFSGSMSNFDLTLTQLDSAEIISLFADPPTTPS
jgi:hypothetical protein